MAKIYRNKAGKKLYPVCKWEDNQHKIYNAHDRIMIRIYEAQENGGEDLEARESSGAYRCLCNRWVSICHL